MKNRVREFRKDLGMTQEELARLVDVHRVTIKLIESNKHTPDMTTVVKLVDALKVPANELFYDLDVAKQ